MLKAAREALGEMLAKPSLMLIAAGVAIGYATVTLAQTVSGVVVMPLISAILGIANLEFESFTIRDAEFRYGALLSIAIAFALVVAVVYLLLVSDGRTAQTRSCPECTSPISAAAKRCPHCTAVVQPEPV